MYTELKVGDFASIKGEPESHRLVISTNGKYRKLGGDFDIWVIYLDKVIHNVVHGASDMYEKIQPTKKLLRRAKRNIKLALNKKEIDNLTFIEISARLREYEQAI